MANKTTAKKPAKKTEKKKYGFTNVAVAPKGTTYNAPKGYTPKIVKPSKKKADRYKNMLYED